MKKKVKPIEETVENIIKIIPKKLENCECKDIGNLVNEVWKDICNYKGYYQISNIGRVKRLSRIITRRGSGNYHVNERIIYPSISKFGYYRIILCKEGVAGRYLVHRLVMLAFKKNINNKPFVNHIDSDRLNNRVENLEWVTASENLIHSYEYGHKRPRIKFIVYCPELNITTLGIDKMVKELWSIGYLKVNSGSIYDSLISGRKHLDLTFINLNTAKELYE